MSKITPYTALCELFRNKVDPNNDLENQMTGTEQHGSVVLLQNNHRTAPTINNACQTQPLKDYSVDKVMAKQKNRKKHCIEKYGVNIALQDDNFQILRPDYAAYSGEKPYAETSSKHVFKCTRNHTVQEEHKELPFTPLFNRNWGKRSNSPIFKETLAKLLTGKTNQVHNQTVTTSLNQTFQERVIEPSKFKNDNIDLDVLPELNLYRRTPKTKQNIHEYTQDLSEAAPIQNPENNIDSSYRNPEVNALYRTVSDLKTTFEKKYHHCENEEKCLCDHCGALAVVNESLKRPIIYDNHADEEKDQHYCRRHRRSNKRSKHDEKEYLKLMMKLRTMEERIHELEEISYVQGPIKISNSDPDLKYDMYTQSSKKKKKSKFAEPETSRSTSPKKNPKVCPFSFTIPSNLKEKIFGRKSSEERNYKSEDTDSDDSHYKVKHVSRNQQREIIPKPPRLRCHDYMNKNKPEVEVKKPSFWKPSGKTNNVKIDETPTKDFNLDSMKDKEIQELLLDLTKSKIVPPVPQTKAVRFNLDAKATQILYKRNQYNNSSKSILNDTSTGVLLNPCNNNVEANPPEMAKETNDDIPQKDYDYFFLKTPEMIEKLVKIKPEEQHQTVNKPDHYSRKKSEIPLPNIFTSSIFQSSYEISNLSSKNSIGRQEEEIMKVLQAMKARNAEFYNRTTPKHLTNEIKTLVSATTASNSVSQYINNNFTNKTSTTNETNSSVTIDNPYNKRSRSLSQPNKKSIKGETKPITTETNRKKLTITLPNCYTRRPRSANRNDISDKHKNFIELNKDVSQYTKIPNRPKRDYTSLHRSPHRKQEEINYITAPFSKEIVTYNIDDSISKTIGSTKVIKQDSDEIQRKEWNFSFIEDNKKDCYCETSKIVKQQMIRELSTLSNSFSIQETENNTANVSKAPSNEVIKKKSSIFSIIKRYSKQLIPKRKSKPEVQPLAVESKPIKLNRVTNKNVSKIPIYCNSDRNTKKSRRTTPSPERNKLQDKFCLYKPEMIDKATTLSNEHLDSDISSYTTTNTDKYEDERDKINDELTMKTLLLNNIDSLFQGRNSSRSSNIIIFNPVKYNRNLPIICEQTSNKTHNNNLSIQTNILANLVPSYLDNNPHASINDNSTKIITAAKDETNTHCISSNDASLNLNPPEINKSAEVPQEKKQKNKSSKKQINKTYYLPLAKKDISEKVKVTDKKKNIGEDMYVAEKCNSEKKYCTKQNICNKDKIQLNNEIIINSMSKDSPTLKTETSKTCTCKNSPLNLPRSLCVRSTLRKTKKKAPKIPKCAKCTTVKKNISFANVDPVTEKKDTPTLSKSPETCFDKCNRKCSPKFSIPLQSETKLNVGDKKESAHSVGSPTKVWKCESSQENKDNEFVQCDTKQDKCKCAPFSQDILLDLGEVDKKKKKPQSKCSLKCVSHTVLPKIESKEQLKIKDSLSKCSCKVQNVSGDHTEPITDKDNCKCPPFNQDILLGPGEVSKQKNPPKPPKSGTSKCSLQYVSQTVIPKKEPIIPLEFDSINDASSTCGCREEYILDHSTNIQNEKKPNAGGKPDCSCAPSAQSVVLLGPGEGSNNKKPVKNSIGKCKRYAPQPPIFHKITEKQSNCEYSLSNLSISFETDDSYTSNKNVDGSKCHCSISSSGKQGTCRKCITDHKAFQSKPLDFSLQKTILTNQSLKCACKPTSSFSKLDCCQITRSNTSIANSNPSGGLIEKKVSEPQVKKKVHIKSKASCMKQCKKYKHDDQMKKSPSKSSIKTTPSIISQKERKIQKTPSTTSKTSDKPCKKCKTKEKVKKSSSRSSIKTTPSIISQKERKIQKTPSNTSKICDKPCKKCKTKEKVKKSSSRSSIKTTPSIISQKERKIQKTPSNTSKICDKPCKKCKTKEKVKKSSSRSSIKTTPSIISQKERKIQKTPSNTSKICVKPCKKCKTKEKLKKSSSRSSIKTTPSIISQKERKIQKMPSNTSKICVKPCKKCKPKEKVKKSRSKTSIKKTLSKTSIKKKPSKTSIKKTPSKTSVKKTPSKTSIKKKPSKTSMKKTPSKTSVKKTPSKTSIKKKPSKTSIKKTPSKTSVKKKPSKESRTQVKYKKKSCKQCKTCIYGQQMNKTDLSPKKSSSIHKHEKPTKKKSKTKVHSRSSSLSSKSTRSSCSVCAECQRSSKRGSSETLTRKSSFKRICSLRRMKNKITSKLSCKYFKSLYKHPIFATASKCKCKEMKWRNRNFCDVSKKDFDRVDQNDPKSLHGGKKLNSSVVNIYYNMQNVCFEPLSDDNLSPTDDDYHLTEEDKRNYLLEKLYLLQDFRDRIHDEGSSSNYGAFE